MNVHPIECLFVRMSCYPLQLLAISMAASSEWMAVADFTESQRDLHCGLIQYGCVLFKQSIGSRSAPAIVCRIRGRNVNTYGT